MSGVREILRACPPGLSTLRSAHASLSCPEAMHRAAHAPRWSALHASARGRGPAWNCGGASVGQRGAAWSNLRRSSSTVAGAEPRGGEGKQGKQARWGVQGGKRKTKDSVDGGEVAIAEDDAAAWLQVRRSHHTTLPLCSRAAWARSSSEREKVPPRSRNQFCLLAKI